MAVLAAGRTWLKRPAAAEEALCALRAEAGVDLPEEYFAFLRFSNGGEGPLPIAPYNFCLDCAEDVLGYLREKLYEEFFPEFFVFGSSGGGDYVAFDLRRAQPWPVVAIDMTNTDLTESVDPIAGDFASFLAIVGLTRSSAAGGMTSAG